MHELYELKDMLCKELKEYGTKGELTAGSLDVVDKLTHAMKNLDKVIEAYEEEGEYSSRSYPDGMGGSYRGYSREGNRSYARGRMNARRDSMGRYSRDDGMIEELRGLMHDAPNEAIRKDIQRLVDKMEQM
jgi:hypothetical protein